MALLAALIALSALGLGVDAERADAHAVLERTEPRRGAALDAAPERVTFRFNEPIEASFGSVRVYDSEGERVESGEPVHPDGDSEAVSVALRPGLADGIYTATFRIISADSHPVSGGFTFSVGNIGKGPAFGVDELIDEAGAGPVTDAALGAARVVSNVGTALLIGAIVFAVCCWLPATGRIGAESRTSAMAPFVRRLRRWLIAALAITAAASAVGIVLQGAVGLGGSFWDALDPETIEAVLGTRFGAAWGWRLVDLAVLAAVILLPTVGLGRGRSVDPLPRSRIATLVLGLGLGYLALVPALAGHPGVTDPRWLSTASNFVHVLAFSVWAGGLVSLVALLPASTRRLESADRAALLAGALRRFSAIALAAVALLLATGIAQTVIQLEAWSELIDTGWGRAVLVKAALLASLIVLGALNRRRSLPAISARAAEGKTSGAPGIALRRTLIAETALITAVLVATAFLAAAPPAGSDDGPFSTTAELGPATLDVTVDPARVGPNEIHLYMFDREAGALYDEPREVRAVAELAEADVEGLAQTVRRAGPGHYVVRDATLAIAGDWTLAVAARVSRFDQYEADLEVPIR